MPLGREVGLSASDIVRWGPSSPAPKRGRNSQFLAHICSVQTAGWIKMPLGREVGLSPSDIVLDWDPAPPPQKGAESPIFGPCLLWPDGSMDQHATWHVGRSRPRPHCVRWGRSSPTTNRDGAPHFRPISVVAKRRMDEDSTWYGIDLSPGHIVLDGDPAPPAKEAEQPPPSFRLASIVAMVAHLTYS